MISENLADLDIIKKVLFTTNFKQKLYPLDFQWLFSCWLHPINILFVWNIKQGRTQEILPVKLQISIKNWNVIILEYIHWFNFTYRYNSSSLCHDELPVSCERGSSVITDGQTYFPKNVLWVKLEISQHLAKHKAMTNLSCSFHKPAWSSPVSCYIAVATWPRSGSRYYKLNWPPGQFSETYISQGAKLNSLKNKWNT